jgi:hypothetical protein
VGVVETFAFNPEWPFSVEQYRAAIAGRLSHRFGNGNTTSTIVGNEIMALASNSKENSPS